MPIRLARFLALALLLGGASPAPAGAAQDAAPPPGVGMASGILVEHATGKVLWAKDPEAQRPPASLTKILTALVVLETADLDEVAQITGEARSVEGGRIYAEAGWTFTIRDLLWGLLLQSGNDAAVALAQKISPDGSAGGFISMMNEQAGRLGTKASTFTNPHGLDDPGHVSTALDLAAITSAAMRNATFAEMVRTKTHDVGWGDGTPHTFINHNRLLWLYPGAIGIKTGFTSGAGNSLASAVDRDGTVLIAIVLGSTDHYGESIALYDWAFANLPALRAASTQRLEPPAEDRSDAGAAAPGLEVVQYDPSTANPRPASAPLVAPILVLLATAGVVVLIRRRRHPRGTSREFASMAEFRSALHSISTHPANGHRGGVRVTVPSNTDEPAE